MSNVTLVFGNLIQESALSVGGSETGGIVDQCVARDGRGRLIIPGRGIAGALIAMAKRFYYPLPNCISASTNEVTGEKVLLPSVWHTFNAHPIKAAGEDTGVWTWCEPDEVPTELRQGVGIRQDTGARADKVLYDLECVPAGTLWSFLLEVRTKEAGLLGSRVEAMAVRVLQQWTEGRCWLGGAVARGLGWLRLRDTKLIRVMDDQWPDSFHTPEETLKKLLSRDGVEVLEGDLLWSIAEKAPPTRSWFFIDIRGTLTAGDDPDGYGLDPIAVGASSVEAGENAPALRHLVKPDGCSIPVSRDLHQTDRPIAMARHADGIQRPFIPGSGLRGPLRHALSRSLRQQGQEIRDPNWRMDTRESGLPGTLFGTMNQSARLLVRDAYIRGDNWTVARLQHHAEDEFAGGPYGSAKFDTAVLLKGIFEWRMVLEGSHQEELEGWKQALCGLIGGNESAGLGSLGHLPVGGLKWRGAGWGRWAIESCETIQVVPTGTVQGVVESRDANRRGQDSTVSTEGIPSGAGITAHFGPKGQGQGSAGMSMRALPLIRPEESDVQIEVVHGREPVPLTLARVCETIKGGAVSWWIEPKADPGLAGQPRPICFGWGAVPNTDRLLDEVMVSMEDGLWRAIRTGSSEYRWVRIREVQSASNHDSGDVPYHHAMTRSWPVILRKDWNRFGLVPQTPDGRSQVRVTEYIVDGRTIGFRWED